MNNQNVLSKILLHSYKKYPQKEALKMKMGYRILNLTYAEVYELSKKIAVFLQENNIKKGDRILICAPNSPYWASVFWACILRGVIIVPINIQSPKNYIENILKQTEAKMIFKHMFFKHEFMQGIKQIDIELIEETVKNLKSEDFQEIQINEDDLVQIMYTSGTTGEPKGVMLTHKNMYSNIVEVSNVIKVSFENDRLLSILPLSHIYEQTIGFLMPFYKGVEIIYAHTYAAIRPLMKEYRITKMIAVPEFLQLITARIDNEVENRGKKKLFDNFIKISSTLNSIWIARLLFYPILKRFGGKLDTIASGGAPLDPEIEKKWKSMGIIILQGYGLTETSPVISSNTFENNRLGSVGKVVPGVKVKLSEDKEILVKGPNVFVGYYKNEEKTKEAFTEDGWFKTGDMGEFDQDGFLFIKGRKKYMIKGPGGQNVYPEDIEIEINKIDGIQDSCVLGIEKSNRAVEIHAVLLLNPQKEIDVEKTIQEANSNLASYQQITAWTVWHDIDFPRTVTRKIKKEEVRQFLKNVDQDSQTVLSDKKSRLKQILSQITGTSLNKISDNTLIVKDLNVDSLKRVELVAWIEEDMGIAIEESSINNKTTVAELEELIKTQKPITEIQGLKKWPRSKWVLPFRFIGQQIFFIFIRIFVKLEIKGKENLENLDLPVVFMPNHTSFMDSLLVAKAIPWKIRKKLSFAAAQDVLYGEYKFFALSMELIFNSFPIQRGDQENIKKGLDYIGQMLDKDFSVVLFPEGKISKDAQLQELRLGAGLIAVEMGTYIVPVKIIGAADIEPYDKIIPVKRGTVTIIFGKPIKFARSDSYSDAIEKIHEAIKNLK